MKFLQLDASWEQRRPLAFWRNAWILRVLTVQVAPLPVLAHDLLLDVTVRVAPLPGLVHDLLLDVTVYSVLHFWSAVLGLLPSVWNVRCHSTVDVTSLCLDNGNALFPPLRLQ